MRCVVRYPVRRFQRCRLFAVPAAGTAMSLDLKDQTPRIGSGSMLLGQRVHVRF
jgi:hypothetical protein